MEGTKVVEGMRIGAFRFSLKDVCPHPRKLPVHVLEASDFVAV